MAQRIVRRGSSKGSQLVVPPPLSTLIRLAGNELLLSRPKQIALSGPGGFLGKHVLRAILDVHAHRKAAGVDPGEVILLSSSPGTLMSRLYAANGRERMATVRACRVDYYHQHDIDSWHDQLGSLGLSGPDAVFLNLAALAGPVSGRPDAMCAVNYRAPTAAARACEALGFGHFIQSSTQATKAERGGQVPYSRWKSMADFSLARMEKLPVSVLSIGLLYSRKDLDVGQKGAVLNMADLSLLPLTPIMGNGMAPLQPLEVDDAAHRLAYLALTEPAARPVQRHVFGQEAWARESWARLIAQNQRHFTLRVYDAVGPDTLSMLELMHVFARLNGRTLRPVLVDYRNFELVLNVASLGNLNRQFVSLLRSEQDAEKPIVGNPAVFEKLLGSEAQLVRIVDLKVREGDRRRHFPYLNTLKWAVSNYGVIPPGLSLGVEILVAYCFGKQSGAPLCLAPPELIDGGKWQRWRRRAAIAAAGAAGAAALLLALRGPPKLSDLFGGKRQEPPPSADGTSPKPPASKLALRGSRGLSLAQAPEPVQTMADAVALRRRHSVSLLKRRHTSALPSRSQGDDDGGDSSSDQSGRRDGRAPA